jgi:thiamine-phosphate pyrophosphorylase
MSRLREERAARFREVDLYPVTSEAHSGGRTSLEVLEGVIAGGARIVQLREKDRTLDRLYPLAVEFRKRTREAGVLLIVNDRVDLALAVDADGVHIGQEDLPLAAARRLAPDLIVGLSTHSLEQALEGERGGADYVNLGPIFPTGTKPEHDTFLGVEAIREIGPRLTIPFTVMGGITAENLDEVVAAGARHVAVVTAVTKAPDVAAAVRSLRARIR